MKVSERNDAPGAVFHVTARVNWQFWHLSSEASASSFLRFLADAAEEFVVNLIGVVLMSNHYHFVCQSPPEDVYLRLTRRRTSCRHLRPWPRGHLKSSVLSQFMHQLMFRTSRSIQTALDLKGRFWDGAFHSRRLWNEDDLVIALAYDHLNPVEKGLCTRPEDYIRSSAQWWDSRQNSPVPLLQHPLPFELEFEALREGLLARQRDKAFRVVLREMSERGLSLSTVRGREELQRLLLESGIL